MTIQVTISDFVEKRLRELHADALADGLYGDIEVSFDDFAADYINLLCEQDLK